MGNKKTSLKLKKSSKHLLTEWKFDAERFRDKKRIAETLVECLMENDLESFKDVLTAHIAAVSKTEFAKASGISRRTLFYLLSDKKFDPKISTISAILKSLKAS